MKKIIHFVMGLFGLLMFNLQLFAELNTTASEGLTAEMKTFYDMTLIDNASPNLVHDQFGQKRPIPKGKGKTIEFRKFAPLELATTPLTEGVTPEGKKMEVTTVTAEVEQYGDYITQTDILELTALDNTILEGTKLLGNQAGATLDAVTRNILHTGTNVTYCPKVAADGTETDVTSRSGLDNTCQLTVKVVQQVVAKLRAQNAPTIKGKYVAIIHPYVAYGLMRDPEWIDAHKYADPTALFEGEIGEIAGVRFVQTTQAKIYEGGVFGSLFMGEGAYGTTEIEGGGMEIIVKQKGSAGTADALDQRSSIGWKATRTVALLVPQFIVRVESKSKKYSGTVQAN